MSKIGNSTNKNISLIKRPRITEKSTLLAEGGKNPVYVFEVMPNADKISIKKAIKEKYNVVATKINIVNLPAKKTFVRGRRGKTAAIKKAFVSLKAGDKIELV